MVTEGDFVAAVFLSCIVKNAATHLGTEAAGIFFFSDIEYNVPKVGFFYDVFNVKAVAQLLYFRIVAVHAAEAVVERNCNNLKVLRIKRAKPRESI